MFLSFCDAAEPIRKPGRVALNGGRTPKPNRQLPPDLARRKPKAQPQGQQKARPSLIFKKSTNTDSVIDPSKHIAEEREKQRRAEEAEQRKRESESKIQEEREKQKKDRDKQKLRLSDQGQPVFRFPKLKNLIWKQQQQPAAPLLGQEIGMPTNIQHTSSIRWNAELHTYEVSLLDIPAYRSFYPYTVDTDGRPTRPDGEPVRRSERKPRRAGLREIERRGSAVCLRFKHLHFVVTFLCFSG